LGYQRRFGVTAEYGRQVLCRASGNISGGIPLQDKILLPRTIPCARRASVFSFEQLRQRNTGWAWLR